MIFFSTPQYLILVPFLLLFLWIFKKKSKSIVFTRITIIKKQLRYNIIYQFIPFLKYFALFLIILAFAKPFILLPQSVSKNIMIVLDTSQSMAIKDNQINSRFEIAKKKIDQLIKNEKNSQLGLLIFGSHAFTICPLTLDHAYLFKILNHIPIGITGNETNLATALTLALQRFPDDKKQNQYILLITDGENNVEINNLEKIIKSAKEKQIKIIPCGVGSKKGTKILITDHKLGVIQAKKADNAPIVSKLEEGYLRNLANLAGTNYYSLNNKDKLNKLFDLNKKITTTKIMKKIFLTKLLIIIAIGLLLIELSYYLLIRQRLFLSLILFILILILIIPLVLSAKIKHNNQNIQNIMIALDLSLSMDTEDISKISRLNKAKAEINSLINQIQHIPFGLIVFAEESVTLCPFTTDYEFLKNLIINCQTQDISPQGTNFNNLFNTLIPIFTNYNKQKVLFLFSDGENFLDTNLIYKKIKKKQIKIFSIALGSKTGEQIPLFNNNRIFIGYKKDFFGKTVISKPNFIFLKKLSTVNNGKFLKIEDKTDFVNYKVIYDKLTKNEK